MHLMELNLTYWFLYGYYEWAFIKFIAIVYEIMKSGFKTFGGPLIEKHWFWLVKLLVISTIGLLEKFYNWPKIKKVLGAYLGA